MTNMEKSTPVCANCNNTGKYSVYEDNGSHYSGYYPYLCNCIYGDIAKINGEISSSKSQIERCVSRIHECENLLSECMTRIENITDDKVPSGTLPRAYGE